MAILALNALDTLFFRDGKPFSLGEETWADGIFPPPLSVLYGALRTAYLSEHIADLQSANSDDDPTKRLKVNYYAYLRSDGYYYPCPLDIVEKKERRDRNTPEYLMLKCVEKTKEHCSSLDCLNMTRLLQSQEPVEDAIGLIDEISLNEYLQNNSVPAKLCPTHEYLKEEPKIGIGRNDLTRSSDDGMLYRVGMKRLSQTNLVIGYSGFDLLGALMRLGGEGKAVSVSVPDQSPNIRKPENILGEYFKLYLATPAIFKDGWRPASEKIPGAELVTAVVGRPVYIGGFDMKPKNGKPPGPKSMRRAVPAGSVYYYRGSIEKAAGLHATSISDYGSEQGYGIVYIGKVNEDRSE
ncbi:MAG TPA: type III-B CRISPR module-associated Cmr3 family protein [Negativicutes bacterium]|nr:type III-B CRISPR module-associated Cmr3 family protein [Negativicutes bacterium]